MLDSVHKTLMCSNPHMKSPLSLKVNTVKYRGDFMNIFHNTGGFGAYYLQDKGIRCLFTLHESPLYCKKYAPNPLVLRKTNVKSPLNLMALTFN